MLIVYQTTGGVRMLFTGAGWEIIFQCVIILSYLHGQGCEFAWMSDHRLIDAGPASETLDQH